MKHKKTAIAIAVAGLMGLSPYAIAGEGWGDKAKQKMESAGDSVERGAETTTEKVKGFFGSDKKQEQAAISPDSLSKDQITEVQKALNEKGFHAANVDGEMGEETSKALKNFQENGYGELPICVAKTQFSFSTDPSLKGAPSGHVLPIREIRLSSGAEFIVVVCGSIMTMPGLPRVPAADSIKINDKGDTEGLF